MADMEYKPVIEETNENTAEISSEENNTEFWGEGIEELAENGDTLIKLTPRKGKVTISTEEYRELVACKAKLEFIKLWVPKISPYDSERKVWEALFDYTLPETKY